MHKTVVLLGLMFFISGCTSTPLGTPISFGGFSMNIDPLFQSFPLDKIQIKKNSQQLLGAYVIPSNDPKIFDINFLISAKNIPATLTAFEYMNINDSKLSEKLQKYRSIDKQKLEFRCGNTTIYGYLHTFSTDQSVGTNQRIFYIAQYYFTTQKQAYTLSFTTSQQSDFSIFEETLNTLQCNS